MSWWEFRGFWGDFAKVSGSLFRAKKDIPGTDIKRGDLTISFRSTEFVDDATRDSQATNTFEIADRGWAFGQISDMVRWVRLLQERGLIDRKLNVTSYSLDYTNKEYLI